MHEIIWGIGNVLSTVPVALLHMAIYGSAHTPWESSALLRLKTNKKKSTNLSLKLSHRRIIFSIAVDLRA